MAFKGLHNLAHPHELDPKYLVPAALELELILI